MKGTRLWSFVGIAGPLVAVGVAFTNGGVATVDLTILDAESHQPTPARVEILDGQGRGYAAEDALVVGDNSSTDPDPWQVGQTAQRTTRQFTNRFTKTDQFYSNGRSRISLPPGQYTVTVTKGPEYLVFKKQLTVKNRKTTRLIVTPTRWIDSAKQGWYSADNHLHILRPNKEADPGLLAWMKAEDIRFSSLLQWGHSKHLKNGFQHTIGAAGVYEEAGYFLVSSQEHPRSFLLGHAIILGSKTLIDIRDPFVVYKRFFEEARRQGAVSGFAHGGNDFTSGLDLYHGLVSFIEVLQRGRSSYTSFWYDALNMGFRLAPTAGTDFMGFTTLPGRERFYTKIDGRPTYAGWLEGIRRGQTFVTNGPFIELSINGHGIGSTITATTSETIHGEGRVRFDPSRDDIDKLEVVVDGEVYVKVTLERAAADIRVHFDIPMADNNSRWVALRASGRRLGEPITAPNGNPWTAEAHTGAIWIDVLGGTPLSEQPRAKELAAVCMKRLESLATQLNDENITKLGPSTGDGIEGDLLRRERPYLLKAADDAHKVFSERAK